MPFACEIYSDTICEAWWGDDCIDKAMEFLENYPDPLLIYAHNGGKFDFSYLAEYIDNPIKLIQSRLVSAKLYHHELRDSFSIMPFSLSKFEKIEIDYAKFERDKREKNKDEILAYLHGDCTSLYELVTNFCDRFGRKLTIGKAAMTELRKLHEFSTMKEREDAFFRQWYFGGRVQCFAGGILKGPWKLYDINAQYPYVMRTFNHPINQSWTQTTRLPDSYDKPFFAIIEARNRGALPVKTEAGLSFNQPHGTFYVTSHELRVALEYGLVDVLKVREVYVAQQTERFAEFVDKFYAEREVAKRNKDRITDLFGKFMLNSPYGKFGQNPRDYDDCVISFDEFDAFKYVAAGYRLIEQWDGYTIWGKKAEVTDNSFYDVSVAASITSAARSLLLEGIQHATDPIYCDTDSLLCRAMPPDRIDPFQLGKFKHESTTDHAVICGKKLYGLFDGTERNPKFLKVRSKGGTLTGNDLLRIANGETVEFDNPVPSYSWRGQTRFIKRSFRTTATFDTAR